ncbi:MAG: hypothetical protein LUI12_10935 [Clostridiales bacterium]|nr:hypothetical protein [Clostridiales bacterium]
MRKVITRIVSFLIISSLFLGGLNVFRYIVTDDVSSYTRIMMHQMYEPESDIDILFVGSSHVYRSLVPDIADDIFDSYTFNAGTSSQYMDGSYAIMEEALENNDVSHIYLELYYGVAIGEKYKERTQLTSTYIIADYMRNPINRTIYLLNASSKEYYVNSFIVARRNWEKLLDINSISAIIKKKNSAAYKNYQYTRDENAVEYYVDRGFVANDSVMAENKVFFSAAYGEISLSNISDDYLNSLESIVNLCERKNVDLTFFMAPMPESTIVGKGNYDAYSSYIKELATSWNIEFYDFNYCKAEYFDSSNYNLFKDEDHLNTTGAEKFTEVFSMFFSGEISYEDLFYESLAEKMKNEQEKIYGIAGLKQINNEINSGYIISNRENGIEYQITISPDEGDEYILQNFSENNILELPVNTTGIVKIEAREAESGTIFQVIEAAY